MVLAMRNAQVRAMDKFFDNALGKGFSPFAAMDKVFDAITTEIPPAHGDEFTLYKMVPVHYRVEHQEDGSVYYKVIGGEMNSTGDKPEAE